MRGRSWSVIPGPHLASNDEGTAIRGWIYDQSLRRLTTGWYQAVLGRLAPGTHLLDIGIGTAGSLLACAAQVVARDLHITGLDIDAAYIERARRRVARAGLDGRIEVRLQSVHALDETARYDAAYFSGSFMLIPEPVHALERVVGALVPGGQVLFTQTFEHRRSAWVERAKPWLRRLTTIDFGQVTYAEGFARTLAEAGVEIAETVCLAGNARRESRLVVGIPASRPARDADGPARPDR